ncbi:MAG: ABC transporter permease [Aestuariibacter sp.]
MWMILRKELLELVRDRKTMFFMIALPLVLFPALFAGIGFFTTKALTEAESKTLSFTVVGESYHPAFIAKINEEPTFEQKPLQEDADFKRLINEGTLDFVIELDEKANGEVLTDGQTTIKVYLNDAKLNLVESRIDKYIEDETASKRKAAFAAISLSEEQQVSLLEPIVFEKVDIAEKRENWGEKIGGLIPYLLFILCLQGAMYPAADIGAGEKERGTLETLLLAPIERNQLVLGKFFTIAIAGVISALTTIFSMALWGVIIGQGMAIQFIQEFLGQIAILDYILMFLMLVPIVAIFAAVLLSLSIYARSYKEAQSYMGALVFLVIFPIVLATLPGVDLSGGWAWVPLTNVALAMKELIKGTMDYVALVGIFVSTAAIAGAFLAFCIYWFKKETVLFR